MQFSRPIKAIHERALASTEGSRPGGPTQLAGEIGRLHSAVQALESVALNRNPADNDSVHAKKTHEAGVRLERAVQSTRQRSNDVINTHSERLRGDLLNRTGLRPPSTLEGLMKQSELRAAVRAMPENARADVLRDAVRAKDSETLSALFNASPLVSGLNPDLVRDMRRAYEASVAPDVVEELAKLLEVDEALQAAARTADKVAADAQDETAMRAFIEAQSAAEAAQSSFNQAINGE